jgi:ATP-dependent helicase HepA
LLDAHADPDHVSEIGHEVHAIVSDGYRVNRRILRNRRERLISQDRLAAISRTHSPLSYEPDQIEAEAVAAAEAFLADLARKTDLLLEVLRPFSHIVLQAMIDPIAMVEVLTAVRDVRGANVNSYGIEMLNAVVGMGGERWRVQLQTACAGVRPHIDDCLLSKALQRANTWKDSETSSGRWDAIAKLLNGEIAAGRKTLVFAGFPGVAERLALFLKGVFGDKVVTEFRTDLDDVIKEENVRRFRIEPGVAVMVSDESGGEGRNFQFAHSLVHADLPWQPAVIEQRIGRLDRLGREAVSREVVSHVCAGASGWEAGLLVCYHEGLDLFGTSISGLEFALRHLQDEIVDTALSAGQDGLCALAPRLKAIAADERVRDESEALLDEGSYSAARATRFVRAPIPGSEESLEEAFLDYFRALSGGKAVRAHNGSDGSLGLWSLRPGDIPHGELNIVDKDAAGELGKRVGTFQRAIAQQRRDIEFFTYGNPLFDAVVSALGQRLTGRTYAIACRAPGAQSFVGLEVIVAARPKLDAIAVPPSLLNLAEAIFGTRRLPLFVPLNPGQTVDRDHLGKLRTSLSLKGDGPRWRDLTGDEVQHVARGSDGDLQACLGRALGEHVASARLAFAAELAAPLAAEMERLSVHRRQLVEAGDPTSLSEAQMLERYAALIGSWDIVIDGLGFLAVNAPGLK